jgi:hypothetical protein
LVVGVLTVHEAEAKPNNGTQKFSISQRAKNFGADCEDLGGEATISYSYEDGKLVSANGSCSGGGYGGTNCTFTADASDCFREPNTITAGTRTVQADLVVMGNAVITQVVDDDKR